MILYGLKTCDTCRKALKSLPDAAFRDVRADGVPPDVLQAAHARFGPRCSIRGPPRGAGWIRLNVNATPWSCSRNIPALMKRPLIVTDDGTLHLGWGKEVQEKLLG